MSTSAPISPTVSNDEFQALEQKVLRAVEVLRHEREARAAAEAEVARLREELAHARVEHTTTSENTAIELDGLRRDREEVRQRVEKMLHQMDELL